MNLKISEHNVREFVGRKIRAEKPGQVIEGIVRGRSDMITMTESGPVHPITVETRDSIENFVPSDGWTLTTL